MRIRFGGTSTPRRNVEEGGLVVRCAQSSGECPGSRSTFREGRDEGARVEVDGADREFVWDARPGGARSVDADDGGGRRVVILDGIGGTRANAG